jgi:hypothetical protein
MPVNSLKTKDRGLAERVGFEPLLFIENKELTGFCLSHDPLNPLESRGRDTYRARDDPLRNLGFRRLLRCEHVRTVASRKHDGRLNEAAGAADARRKVARPAV